MGLRTDLFIFVDLTKPISLPNLYRMDGLGEGMGGRQPAQRRLSRARRLALPSLRSPRGYLRTLTLVQSCMGK